MKKTLVTTLCTLALITVAQANAANNDACLKMPGHWEGSFTFKNETDCKQFGGCTHQITGEVSHIGDNDYVWLVNSIFGEKEVDVICENGQITNIPGNILTCEGNACTLRYDGQKMSAELNKR